MEINRQLRDLISLQDDITHCNEANESRRIITDLQNRRDKLMSEIVQSFVSLQSKLDQCKGGQDDN